MPPRPAESDGAFDPGAEVVATASCGKKRRIDALVINATVLHGLDVVRDLDDFARGGISIGEGMIVDELFHAAARSYFSTPRITIFSASSWVSFGHRGGFCPAFLLSAIGRNRMRQEDAGAQHNKSSYSKRDHRAHHVAQPDTGFRHTSRPSK